GGAVQLHRVIADVASFNGDLAADFTRDAEVPLHDVRSRQILLEGPQVRSRTGSEVGLRRDRQHIRRRARTLRGYGAGIPDSDRPGRGDYGEQAVVPG